ncbi:MAG TPA: hypothetical protein VNT81_07940 [Vicinamibacterales bacterium]|nr:hypothetical protein [Vicinamibacterales bacterium]
MRILRAGLRPAFGLLVIAHGLAHSVLPMRGWIDPARLSLDFMPFILYVVAVCGFTIAGLGVLGVRPFTSMMRPAMVLASAYSLVAMSRFGQGGLWWGATLDVVLLLTGLTGAYRYLPAMPAATPAWWRTARSMAGFALLAYAVSAVLLWPLHRAWGSDPIEHVRQLPGDRPDRNRNLELQHAVTVNAPPEAVWQWLVQLGQDRAGFYSYDWLERAFGVEVRNVAEVRPEWQPRKAGDRVIATQPGYLGGLFGHQPGWTVHEMRPNRAMVLDYWGAFVLEPLPDGKTRFIIRTTVGHERTPAWAAPLDMMAFELPHFIMERKMMLRIKELAEGKAAAPGKDRA